MRVATCTIVHFKKLFSSGPITHLPKLSWNIVSSSVAAPKEENQCKEDLINSKKEDKLVVEDDTSKSSASKVDTVPVKSTGPKSDVRKKKEI